MMELFTGNLPWEATGQEPRERVDRLGQGGEHGWEGGDHRKALAEGSVLTWTSPACEQVWPAGSNTGAWRVSSTKGIPPGNESRTHPRH